MNATATAPSRRVALVLRGQPTSDGAGVKLTRVIGQRDLDMLDPFLLLDEFRSDSASDYIGGFPSHPHRGFETVTYMLAGRMRHADNQGNSGLLTPGSVQWMSAGRGIVHSEMPEQEDGLMWGFQLWVDLPAGDKMSAPRYQDIAPERVPEITQRPVCGCACSRGNSARRQDRSAASRSNRCISISSSGPTCAFRHRCRAVTTSLRTSMQAAPKSVPRMRRSASRAASSPCSSATVKNC